MPTYEYECQDCSYRFELLQKITAEPIKKCPKCNKDSVKRLISAGVGIIFKGSGFYETDYKRSKKKENPAPRCDMTGTKPGCSCCPGAK